MKMRLLSSLALFATAAGCSFAPSVEDVQNATTSATTAICDNAGSGAESVGNMPTVGALGTGMGSMLKVSPDLVQQLVLPKPEVMQVVQQFIPAQDGVAAKAGPTVQQETTAARMHAQGQSIAKFLRERIFTEENVEEKTFDAIIFRITGEDVCVYEDANGKFQPTPDTACIPSFDRFEVRIRAQRPDASLSLTLLLGPDRYAPLALDFTHDSFGVTTDFAELKSSYLYIASVTGTNVTMPEVMEGKVRVAATRYGDNDFGVAVSVLQAVKVEQSAGSAKYFLRTAAKSPVAEVRFMGLQKRLLASVELGPTELGQPYATYYVTSGTHVAGTQMTWHLGGASYSFDTREGDTELLVSNIGLGDEQTSWDLDGAKLTTLDLNAVSGRHFDLRVVTQTGTNPLFKFSPELTFAEHVGLGALAADTTVPAWAYSENLSMALNGTDPTLQAIPYDPNTGAPGALKVVSGKLTLAADEPGFTTVTVNAGQCLLRDPASASAHPFGGYYAGVCP